MHNCSLGNFQKNLVPFLSFGINDRKEHNKKYFFLKIIPLFTFSVTRLGTIFYDSKQMIKCNTMQNLPFPLCLSPFLSSDEKFFPMHKFQRVWLLFVLNSVFSKLFRMTAHQVREKNFTAKWNILYLFYVFFV